MEQVSYKSMYKSFLTLVRKSRVGTVHPEEFTDILNQAIDEVVDSKLSAMEVNKTVYDDMAPLRVTKRDESMSEDDTDTYTSYICDIDKSGTNKGYRRIAAVSVTIGTVTNIKCHLLSSIERTEVLGGYYSKPSMRKCYYEPLNALSVTSPNDPVQSLRIYVPKGTTSDVSCRYDIYKNPKPVLVSEVTSENEYSEFSKSLSMHIVNVAARIYLESIADSRYKSFLVEQQNKLNN